MLKSVDIINPIESLNLFHVGLCAHVFISGDVAMFKTSNRVIQSHTSDVTYARVRGNI